jgi:hypothetical protein
MEVLDRGVVLFFRVTTVQLTVGGKEEPAIEVHWIMDDKELCHVGFLPREYVPQAKMFHERVAIIAVEDYQTVPTAQSVGSRMRTLALGRQRCS